MKYLFWLISFVCSSTLMAQVNYLIPYRDGNLWGYSDTNANIVIQPRYEEANPFTRGYALVVNQKRYGVVNMQGKVVVPIQYEAIQDCCFSPFLTAVQNGNKGLVELKTGKVVLPFQYQSFSLQYDRIYIATDTSGIKGLFDTKAGKWLLPKEYEDISAYSFENAITYYSARGKGQTIHFTLNDKRTFQIMTTVRRQKQNLAQKAEIVSDIHPQTVALEELSASDEAFTYIAGFYNKNGKQGIIVEKVQNGKRTSDSSLPIYYNLEWIKGISHMLLASKEGKRGVIDVSNNEIIPFQYDEVIPVDSTSVHGTFIVKKAGKYGLESEKGILLACEYDAIYSTSYNMKGFGLTKNGKHGAYIYDRERKLYNVFIPALYDYVSHISSVQAADFHPTIPYNYKFEGVKFIIGVTKDGKKGFVDLTGKEFFKD